VEGFPLGFPQYFCHPQNNAPPAINCQPATARRTGSPLPRQSPGSQLCQGPFSRPRASHPHQEQHPFLSSSILAPEGWTLLPRPPGLGRQGRLWFCFCVLLIVGRCSLVAGGGGAAGPAAGAAVPTGAAAPVPWPWTRPADKEGGTSSSQRTAPKTDR